MPFHHRAEAGQELAAQLLAYQWRPDVLVLGLPRGGVPVAFEVARALHAPLDVLLVRKLGVPDEEELAMGAIASGGVRILNQEIVRALCIPETIIEAVTAREQQELSRREHLYRGDRQASVMADRVVILVDDGIATGATMRAAIAVVRDQHPARLIAAIPVAPPSVCQVISAEVDEWVCLLMPDAFLGVGQWYQDFPQITDEQVRDLLEQSRHALPA
jgi:putative phosphoribosyl transferase